MIAAYTTELRRLRRATTGKQAAFAAALVVCILIILVAAPQAQQPPQYAALTVPPPSTTPDGTTEIDLLVGRSTVLNVGSTISRVSLTVPDIADAMVTAPTQLLIHGKQPGTISLFVWDRGGVIKTYEVKVRRDLSALGEQMLQLFPGEQISVVGSGKDVVISGTVSSKYVIEKAGDVAGGYVEKKENVVNLLKQQEGVASNQVMLRVRFAEVSRSALQELGVSLNAHGFKNDWYGRSTTQQFASGQLDEEGKLVFSDFLNLFVFNAKEGLGGVVRALQNKGLFQSLAEPNLIATNGKEASFLAGGEFPIPVVQSSTGGNAVTVMFKEFGIRLNFTPTVLGGDLINLKVRPEVSALDFANAITLNGFRIPALTTRRTETEVELRDGQTFAIAGLMNNTLTNSMSKIPGIGDIPIIGLLFRSKAHQKNQTELVVMITPTIIRRGQMGVSEGLPSLVEPYMGAPSKTHPNPTPFIGSPRYPSNQSQPSQRTESVTPAPAAPASATPAAKPAVRPAAPVNAQPKPAPIPSTPVVQPAPLAATAPASETAPAAETMKPVVAARPVAPAPTKAELKAREDARKRQAEQQAEEQNKLEEDRRQADKIAKARAKREAEVAKKNAELARVKMEADQKREKSLAEAAARLKEAQAAYQAEIEKAKGQSNDKTKSSGKATSPSTPR